MLCLFWSPHNMVSEAVWNPSSSPYIGPFISKHNLFSQTTPNNCLWLLWLNEPHAFQPLHYITNRTMPKHDKPLVDINAVRANRDHFRHWETRLPLIRRLQKSCLRQINTNGRSLHRSKKTIRVSRASQRDPFVRMEHPRRCNHLQDPPPRWCWQAMDLATKN